MNAKISVGLIGVLILVCVLPSADARAQGRTPPVLLERTYVSPDVGLEFRADVYAVPFVRDGEDIGNYKLVIRCVKGCTKKISYAELMGSPPLGMFPFNDDSDQLVTRWVGGSVSFVQIYRVSVNGIKKVFDEATGVYAQYGMTEKGAPVVILGKRDTPSKVLDRRPEGTFTTHGLIYQWDGKQYNLVQDAQ